MDKGALNIKMLEQNEPQMLICKQKEYNFGKDIGKSNIPHLKPMIRLPFDADKELRSKTVQPRSVSKKAEWKR